MAASVVGVKVVRDDDTVEWARRKGLRRRLTLRRSDGRIYLSRWGVAHDRLGGVFLHRMDAPDPGLDLHDHPWWFASIVVWGGYHELRAETRIASEYAKSAGWNPGASRRGVEVERRPGTIRTLRLDECHTITGLRRRCSWTLIVRGPRRRGWGFYLPGGFMGERVYDQSVRPARRDLWSDQDEHSRPW